jgi:hypothetical protein
LACGRALLACPNLMQKMNYACGSCFDGPASSVNEVAVPTEPCRCPIKRAWRVRKAHSHDNGFVDFGDAESCHREPEALPDELATPAG